LINRILTEEDLSRLRELRVKNLMKLWNRKREEVGLKEEEDSDYEIRDNEIKSLTTIRLEAKERRKETALNKSSKQKTWQEYSKKRGGTKSNKESNRNKPFQMTKHASKILQKI